MLMYFSSAIFQQAGIPQSFVGIASILFFVVNLISSFVCGLIVDKWGRRVMFTVSCCGMGVCLLAVFALSFFDSNITIAYVIIGPICAFNAFAKLGCVPIPFMIAAELIPVNNRGTVQSLGVTVDFLGQFVVITLFPLLETCCAKNLGVG